MGRYYVDDLKDVKDYGVFISLLLKRDKTLGIFGKERYVFNDDVFDHYGEFGKLQPEVGEYNLAVSVTTSGNKRHINILYFPTHYEEINGFDYRCVIDILDECRQYLLFDNRNMRVSVPGVFFTDKMDRDSYDVNAIYNDLIKSYEKFKHDNKHGIKIKKLFRK